MKLRNKLFIDGKWVDASDGTVWMNLYNFVFPTGPYGGCKDSGIGRELGREGLLALTQTRSVMLSLYPPPTGP